MSRTFDEIQQDLMDVTPVEEPRLYFFDVNKAGILAPKTQNAEGNSDLGMLKNEQAILEAVYNILLTQPGERVMNPDFGCDLNQYLFAPIDDNTAFSILKSVEAAVIQSEPRVIKIEIEVEPKPDENTFIIDIYLTLDTSNDPVKLTTTLEKVR